MPEMKGNRMLFNSYQFIFVFLPLLLIGWNILQKVHIKSALVFLTLMSMWMYGSFDIRFLITIISTSLITYLISYWLSRKKSKLILFAGIAFQLLVLGYFKYTGFFVDNVNAVFKTDINFAQLFIPIGISFYSFGQIAFLVDRYKEEIEHIDILSYFAYTLYFPKIMQGPIAFPKEILDQMFDEEKIKWNADRVLRGLILFSIGLGKKVLLADYLGLVVDYLYSQVYYLDTLCVIMAGLTYAFQIYFDFSGYCDMADGISRMLGINLPQNFNSPYQAESAEDLWRRWHITLNRFLIKYVYIPLGGSRKGKTRTLIHIMIIFTLSGLWHGAAWTYIVWGVMQGLTVIWDKVRPFKIGKKFGQVCTFAFFCFSMLFFRAKTLEESFVLIQKLFFFTWPGFTYRAVSNLKISELYVVREAVEMTSMQYSNILYMIIYLLLIGISFFVITRKNAYSFIEKKEFTKKELVGIALIAALSILSLSRVQTYIYFNF